jgi:hypothetical protein
MRGWIAAGAALWIAVSAQGAAAQVNMARAEQTCISAALERFMFHRQTLSQKPLRDSRGRVTGSVLEMEVRFLGKKTVVFCIFDAAKAAAVIEVSPRGPSRFRRPMWCGPATGPHRGKG